MRAETLAGGLDVRDEVLALLEVDPLGRAELLDELALGVARVDGNNLEAHVDRVLHGQVAQSSTSSGNGDVVSRLDIGDFESFVGCHAGAEERGGSGGVERLRDRGDVVNVGYDVLREGAVDGVPGKLGSV